ncbi:unnamed protein product [Adineta ricciae]|uniref:N-acetyltransferase domain-containing protein n=1 Tax=Adineta ricciae TaxID=249248 RepID=A0A815S9E2_ADIRI|nr:unnamed protein product [Adineta ricciae]
MKSIPVDSERFHLVKDWILSMTEYEDNENGSDFWNWIETNNELSKTDSTNLLNTFFAFLAADPNRVVATGSIVADDRDMGKKLRLEDGAWIGGVNVHRDFRGKSIGRLFVEYLDNYIQQTIKKDTMIYLFTNNPQAKTIYRRYHFQSKKLIGEETCTVR